MSAKAPKPNIGLYKKQAAALRKDVREAIERLWPDGIVENSVDPDDNYFLEVHEKLSTAFHRIPRARLINERDKEGGPVWWGEADTEEDPPDDFEHSRSYHTFFVSPEGKAFAFETEIEGIDETEFMDEELDEDGFGEDPPLTMIHGKGRTGWVVAVSLLAPFAVIELGEETSYEDGTGHEAEIEYRAAAPDGGRIDLEEEFVKTKGALAYQTLLNLRAKIAAILEKSGIAVLPAEEWRKPAPWLRGAEETIAAIEGRPMRVLDAFFFESM